MPEKKIVYRKIQNGKRSNSVILMGINPFFDMKTIQTHTNFYIEMSPEEILICPKFGLCTTYPIWLGKNRAIMRNAIALFEKDPPRTFVESIGLAGRLGLIGMSSSHDVIPELFVEEEEDLDNNRIFW